MKKNLFCDPYMFSEKNAYNFLGNKLLHIFFVINAAHEKNMVPILPKNTIVNELFNINNDNLFDFNHEYIKGYIIKNINCLYRENSAFSYYNSKNIFEYILKKILVKLNSKTKNLKLSIDQSKRQHYEGLNFFKNKNINEHFYVKGHFWSYSLMPKKEVLFN